MEIVTELALESDTKILLYVIDGLGGVRTPERGSELFEARTPNFDGLAAQGACGLHLPVAPGVTPGSGAGHLALFGYDPKRYRLGRGALSAAGVGFELREGDVAARVNFCTLDAGGVILDRRAGRIPSVEGERLCKILEEGVALPDAEAFFVAEKEHRALLVLRGEGLSPRVSDTDPQSTSFPPLEPHALTPEAQSTTRLTAELLRQSRALLADERANFILLRGFEGPAALPSFADRYALRALGVADYPVYRGIARLAGMEVGPASGSLAETAAAVRAGWDSHDFFYVHHKSADAAGEDGNFDGKVAAIEEADEALPEILGNGVDVVCVTGDHATPSQMRSHSWHAVPFLLRGKQIPPDSVQRFDEESAQSGAFGILAAKHLMGLMLGAAGRLAKFGA